MSDSRLINRNVVAKRGRTSMRLEPELWAALTEIAEREGKDLSSLVRMAEDEENPGGRTSAVRVFVLDYFRSAATDTGHVSVGHGLQRSVLVGTDERANGLLTAPPPLVLVEAVRSAA